MANKLMLFFALKIAHVTAPAIVGVTIWETVHQNFQMVAQMILLTDSFRWIIFWLLCYLHISVCGSTLIDWCLLLVACCTFHLYTYLHMHPLLIILEKILDDTGLLRKELQLVNWLAPHVMSSYMGNSNMVMIQNGSTHIKKWIKENNPPSSRRLEDWTKWRDQVLSRSAKDMWWYAHCHSSAIL